MSRFLFRTPRWFHDSNAQQNWPGYERTQLIPVYIQDYIFQFPPAQRSEVNRNQYCEQFSADEKRAWQSSALKSTTKTLNTDLVSIGDDIEPIGESRADVEMGNDEDEDPLEAEIPGARMNPKNPTSREKQEHEDSGHAAYRSWCAACVEGRGVGEQHRIELLDEEERETTTPTVALDCGFKTKKMQTRFRFLFFELVGTVKLERHVANG